MGEPGCTLADGEVEGLQDYERKTVEFEDYVQARGAWAYIFWTIVFILGTAIVWYSNILYVFEVLFALFLFRIISWFGMEYYRCN